MGVRIIGGTLGGRRLRYRGDPRTRPMKDRLREAIFNIIGPAVQGKHALDLFAGTGALGIEALSRGAVRATLIEQHRPTAALIGQNLAELGVVEKAEVVAGNTFVWWQRCGVSGSAIRDPGTSDQGSVIGGPREKTCLIDSQSFPFREKKTGEKKMKGERCPANSRSLIPDSGCPPWLVFCSPPYAFYIDRKEEMLELIGGLLRAAPAESIFVVEADDRFDFQALPEPATWNVRAYPPAVVGIHRGLSR